MNKDAILGAARSRTVIFNALLLFAATLLPELLKDAALVQQVISMLPANWQTIGFAFVGLANVYLRAKTTESLADKGAEKLL